MQDLEENNKILLAQKSKLKDLGDSLWHPKTRTKLKRIRKSNDKPRFLGRQQKYKHSIIKNKKLKK